MGLVPQSLDENVFDLITAVLKRDQAKALDIYQQLLETNHEPLQLNALLVSQFRLLIQIKVLSKRGLSQGMERRLATQKERLGRAAAALDAMSPLKVLSRGYSMTTGQDGGVITSAEQVQAGDRVQVRLRSGSLGCTVVERSLPDGESKDL